MGDIRAAIESVAPSVHSRSDGNHLSVTISKHNTPILKSPTYPLQSNQLRQARIVVPMVIICQSQCRTQHTRFSNSRHTSCNQISCAKHALSFGWKSLSVTTSKHNTPSSEIAAIRAAIESVAPSVHCRSDGNHLSVTNVETQQPLFSNHRHTSCNRISCAKRALSFGWKSFVSHNVQTQHPRF
jgi:hypothetical protein